VFFDNNHLVFKAYWAITLDQKLLRVGVPKSQVFTKVNHFWKLVPKLTVYDRECVDRDQDFISLAVDANRIVVVLVGLITCRSKLHVDILRDSSRQHSFFVVPDLEVWCLWRQDMKPLGSR